MSLFLENLIARHEPTPEASLLRVQPRPKARFENDSEIPNLAEQGCAPSNLPEKLIQETVSPLADKPDIPDSFQPQPPLDIVAPAVAPVQPSHGPSLSPPAQQAALQPEQQNSPLLAQPGILRPEPGKENQRPSAPIVQQDHFQLGLSEAIEPKPPSLQPLPDGLQQKLQGLQQRLNEPSPKEQTAKQRIQKILQHLQPEPLTPAALQPAVAAEQKPVKLTIPAASESNQDKTPIPEQVVPATEKQSNQRVQKILQRLNAEQPHEERIPKASPASLFSQVAPDLDSKKLVPSPSVPSSKAAEAFLPPVASSSPVQPIEETRQVNQTQQPEAPQQQVGVLQPPDWLRNIQADLQSRWQPPPKQTNSEPVVNVSIGRVEIRAEQAAVAQPKARQKPSGVMSLGTYLKQRENRE